MEIAYDSLTRVAAHVSLTVGASHLYLQQISTSVKHNPVETSDNMFITST